MTWSEPGSSINSLPWSQVVKNYLHLFPFLNNHLKKFQFSFISLARLWFFSSSTKVLKKLGRNQFLRKVPLFQKRRPVVCEFSPTFWRTGANCELVVWHYSSSKARWGESKRLHTKLVGDPGTLAERGLIKAFTKVADSNFWRTLMLHQAIEALKVIYEIYSSFSTFQFTVSSLSRLLFSDFESFLDEWMEN